MVVVLVQEHQGTQQFFGCVLYDHEYTCVWDLESMTKWLQHHDFHSLCQLNMGYAIKYNDNNWVALLQEEWQDQPPAYYWNPLNCGFLKYRFETINRLWAFLEY